MQQVLVRNRVKFAQDASVSRESLLGGFRNFSVDSELLTKSNFVIAERQRGGFESGAPLRKGAPDSAWSSTMIGSGVVPFPFFKNSIDGIAGEELQSVDELNEEHNRELLVRPLRKVIFSKDISIAPGDMRQLQPKIVLDDRYSSCDED